jgi:hypothetical protein
MLSLLGKRRRPFTEPVCNEVDVGIGCSGPTRLGKGTFGRTRDRRKVKGQHAEQQVKHLGVIAGLRGWDELQGRIAKLLQLLNAQSKAVMNEKGVEQEYVRAGSTPGGHSRPFEGASRIRQRFTAASKQAITSECWFQTKGSSRRVLYEHKDSLRTTDARLQEGQDRAARLDFNAKG